MVYPRLTVEVLPDTVASKRRRDGVVLSSQHFVYRFPNIPEWSTRSASGDPGFESGFRDGHEFSALLVLHPARQRKVLQW